jgi:hypothetical protein
MDTQSEAPKAQSLMCSMAELAAEAALDNFLASMISAPLFPTLGLNHLETHSYSTYSKAVFPLTLVALKSGTIVGEWCPQMLKFWILPRGTWSLGES